MAITIQQAKAICSAAEFQIIAASQRPALLSQTPTRLRRNAALARGLRDKYRTLAEHQQRQKRRKSPHRTGQAARAASIQTTRLKQHVFQEALDRFAAALKSPAASRPRSRPVAPAPKTRKKKARSTPRAGRTTKPAPRSTSPRPAQARIAPPPSVKSTPQVEARDTARRTRAARSTAARKSLHVSESGYVIHRSAMAGHARRVQGKRDNRSAGNA